MSEVGDMYREIAEESRVKRAANRESSAQVLTDAGVEFVTKNFGAHLIVQTAIEYIDFWPGTGLWQVRGGRRGRGVKQLLAYLDATTSVFDDGLDDSIIGALP